MSPTGETPESDDLNGIEHTALRGENASSGKNRQDEHKISQGGIVGGVCTLLQRHGRKKEWASSTWLYLRQTLGSFEQLLTQSLDCEKRRHCCRLYASSEDCDFDAVAIVANVSGNSIPPTSFMTCIIGGSVFAILCKKLAVAD